MHDEHDARVVAEQEDEGELRVVSRQVLEGALRKLNHQYRVVGVDHVTVALNIDTPEAHGERDKHRNENDLHAKK